MSRLPRAPEVFNRVQDLFVFPVETSSNLPQQQQQHSKIRDPLEIVFLLDRTSALVLKEMPRLITITDDLSKQYSDAKFGVSLYGDFICSDWHNNSSRHCGPGTAEGGKHDHHEDPEGCYTFSTGLTRNSSVVKASVQPGVIQIYPSGGTEAGMAGLMMTAAETKMGWTTAAKKVIIVVSDDATHHSSKPYGGRDAPKGDGTDSCASTQNPTLRFTGNILKEKGMSLFMLLTNDPPYEKTFERWIEVGENLGVNYDIAYMRYPTDLIAKKLKNFIKE